MYQYYIYGLKIDSEIKLYHLDECPNTIRDVHIHYEHMNEKINQFVQDGYASGIFEGSVWFRNSTGIFQIKNGNEIIIQPQPNATEDDIASFILGWCIAFLFMQRGASALHCSALEINNQAVLISGCSGSGKSTLALALLEKGYRYLADDIAMVNPQNDLMIAPAFPMQKVCRNVAEQMDTDTLIYINEKKDKFAMLNHSDFCSTPQKLTTIFLLKKHDGNELIIEELQGISKWEGILNNLFLADAYKALGLPFEESNRCLEIASKVRVYSIQRPSNRDTVTEICNRLIKIIKEN